MRYSSPRLEMVLTWQIWNECAITTSVHPEISSLRHNFTFPLSTPNSAIIPCSAAFSYAVYLKYSKRDLKCYFPSGSRRACWPMQKSRLLTWDFWKSALPNFQKTAVTHSHLRRIVCWHNLLTLPSRAWYSFCPLAKKRFLSILTVASTSFLCLRRTHVLSFVKDLYP